MSFIAWSTSALHRARRCVSACVLEPLRSGAGAWRRMKRPSKRPGASRASGSIGPDKLTVIVTLAFVATTLGVFVVDLHSRYHEAIAAAKTSALSYAQILAEHTARTLEGVDHILQQASAIRRDAKAGRHSSQQRLNEALRLLQHGSPVLLAVGWTDANGDLEAHTYVGDPPRRNIADLSHFKAQRDAVRDQLFVAPPFRSVASGEWVSAASRRLANDDGSFAGVLTAVIKQSYFRNIFRAVQLGPNDYVTLATTDGWVIAREPFVDELIGRSFAGGPIYSRDLVTADSGVIENASAPAPIGSPRSRSSPVIRSSRS
jgi:hypothetical protein